MLLSLVKKSFKQVVENNSIILFLVTYLIVISLIAPLARTGFLMISLGICLFLLTVVYFSGWFQTVTTIAKTSDEEIKNKNMFSIFLEGIGKNFVSVLIAMIFYFAMLAITLYFTGMIANHFFGDINIILRDLMTKATENSNLLELISTLSDEQQYTLYSWQFCLIIAGFVFGFIFMMYCPFLINSKSNMIIRPLTAFYDSIIFTFKNFLTSVGLYVLVYFVYMILSILRALTESNMVVSVILLFVYIYFLAIVVMIIFNYYEAKNNSSNRPDCIGENETIDSAGENS